MPNVSYAVRGPWQRLRLKRWDAESDALSDDDKDEKQHSRPSHQGECWQHWERIYRALLYNCKKEERKIKMPHLLSGAAKGAAHLIPDGKTQFLALQYTARRDTVIRSAKIRTFF